MLQVQLGQVAHLARVDLVVLAILQVLAVQVDQRVVQAHQVLADLLGQRG